MATRRAFLRGRQFDDDPVAALEATLDKGLDDEVRRAVVSYTGGDIDGVALTDSTTMGIGLVYGGLRLGPDDEIICFDVAGRKPADVVAHLRTRHIIATTSPYPVSYVRVTPALFNTPAELDTVLAEIRALA